MTYLWLLQQVYHRREQLGAYQQHYNEYVTHSGSLSQGSMLERVGRIMRRMREGRGVNEGLGGKLCNTACVVGQLFTMVKYVSFAPSIRQKNVPSKITRRFDVIRRSTALRIVAFTCFSAFVSEFSRTNIPEERKEEC